MSNQIDWQQELDRVIQHGPERPVHDYVASGRRAVRRRRATATLGGLATALVVGGLGWTALPDEGGSSTESHVAGQGPSPTEQTEPTVPPSGFRDAPFDPRWGADEPPVRLHPDGGYQARFGAPVLQHHDYPGGGVGSAALDVRYDGQRWWIMLDWDGASDGMVRAAPHEHTEPDLVPEELASWTSEGLELRDGVSLEARVDNPFGLKAPESSVGLALQYQGRTSWVIATAGPAGSSIASVNAADSGWLTFDQWLAEQVARRGGGPGVRLVTMAGDGTLRPAEPGVEVVEEVIDPVLSAYPNAAPTPGTVGKLSWNGGTWFVHVTRSPDAEGIRTFASAKVGGADSIGEFTEYLRRRNPDGGGPL